MANREGGGAFFFKGGRHGCLLLHGFTGSAWHMRFLGERLREGGYTVSAPLLPGHGATIETMRASNWHEWLDGARTSYTDLRRRCDVVTVCGLSMGGALALILAEEYPVDGLVCLSAAIRARTRYAWLAPALSMFLPYLRWGTDEERARTRDFLYEYDVGYEGMPLNKVSDLMRVMRLAERNLFAVVAPTLVIQPAHDETVDPRSAQIIMKGISSSDKRLIMLPESGHMCVLDCDREQVVGAVFEHLKNIDQNRLPYVTNHV